MTKIMLPSFLVCKVRGTLGSVSLRKNILMLYTGYYCYKNKNHNVKNLKSGSLLYISIYFLKNKKTGQKKSQIHSTSPY